MTLVKICGIQEKDHALVAAESGASLIGFVFVPVRREIDPDDARQIIDSVREKYMHPPAAVGLFVNEPANTINEVVEQVGLDFVQLHGDEDPELASQLSVPAIKALRIEEDQSEAQVRKRVEAYLRYCSAVLLDSHVPGHWGGTGVKGDWDLAATIARDYPVILAGGLTPENVGEAIETVRPAVVDVSSGVETDEQKDPAKIVAFLENANEQARQIRPSKPSKALKAYIESVRLQHTLKHQPGID